MKQKHVILQNILTHGTCIHTSRDEWSLEIIRDPRPSCLEALHIRQSLRSLFPGEQRKIAGVWVTKVDQVHKAVRFRFDGKRQYTFDQAIEVIEGIREEKSA